MKQLYRLLPDDWEIIPSSSFCHKVADGTHDTPKPVLEGRKLLTSKHIKEGNLLQDDAYLISEKDYNDINRRSKVDKGDVLFSMIGTVGEIALVKEEPDFAIKNIGLFKCKNEVDGRWLYYYLTSTIGKGTIEAYSTGTSQQFVSLGDLRKLPIINPTPKFKQRIASILSAYDDLIEVNNQRIKLLEQTARELYKEWFVRMRFPGYKLAKFKKGIPVSEGVVIYFKDFIKLNRGFDLPENKVVEGIYPVVASTNIKTYHNQFKVKAPIIVTGRSGSLGKVQYVNQDGWPHNTALYVKDYKGNEPLYVFHTMLGMDFESFNSGAGVPTLNQNHLHKLKLWVAAKPLQEKFKKIVEPMTMQIETLQKQNTQLRQIRDRLLPRLISGKLQVSESRMERIKG